ncbi:MAG TPA: YceI family protein [Trichormus sp.]|jgi:polyisoprenoid-binding protein YceI
MARGYLFVASILALTSVQSAQAESWKIDPMHSAAQFAVKHMMISTVRGQFSKVSGTVDYDPKHPKDAKVEATIDVGSVDTREPKRDDHLRSADFFDTQKFPTMTFKSTRVIEATPGKLKLAGDLTLHGVTKEVTLDVDGPSAPITDQHGGTKIGASATTTINRKDFGVSWNKALDNGGMMLGEDVPITIDVELVKAAKVAENR